MASSGSLATTSDHAGPTGHSRCQMVCGGSFVLLPLRVDDVFEHPLPRLVDDCCLRISSCSDSFAETLERWLRALALEEE